MSVRADRLRAYGRRLGLTVTSVRWEPIGGDLEMCGPSGGWVVEMDCGTAVGYNVREIMASMKYEADEQKRIVALRGSTPSSGAGKGET